MHAPLSTDLPFHCGASGKGFKKELRSIAITTATSLYVRHSSTQPAHQGLLEAKLHHLAILHDPLHMG